MGFMNVERGKRFLTLTRGKVLRSGSKIEITVYKKLGVTVYSLKSKNL